MTDGVWQMGWAQNGVRCAVWLSYTGAVWSWVWDRDPTHDEEEEWDGTAIFKLAVRPVGQGETKPSGESKSIPLELYEWVLDGDPVDK